jgi:hypothetical protein
MGLADKPHVYLLRGMPCFATVAGDTTTNHILPDMLATTVARDYVIQSQLFALLSAILASIVIPIENPEAGELFLRMRGLNHINYAYH